MAGCFQATEAENVLSMQVKGQTTVEKINNTNSSTHNLFLYRNTKSQADILQEISEIGIGAVTRDIAANAGTIPATHSKALKEAIASQVPSHNYIDF